ncbi:MAG TPA: cation:proton antiporter [Pirellulaceae bacterium]|nr:cation:proton antiporter [Pirellulaceae bacterium]
MSGEGSILTASEHRRPERMLAVYLLLGALAVGAFFVIRMIGEQGGGTATAAAVVEQQPAHAPATHVLPHLLGGLIAVIVLARLLGFVLRYLGQPSVIGEVIAGIVLGPSILGRFSPEAVTFLFPPATLPILSAIAQLGVILYMFLVGLHLNAGLLSARAHTTVMISHASIAAPFLLGAILALWLFPGFAPAGIPFTSFSLFLGLAMAITAFPVLARILTDRRMERSELGVVALSCAAADDVTAWCLLALVVGVAQTDLIGAVTTILLATLYLAAMFWIVRPLLRRWFGSDRETAPRSDVIAAVLVAVLASSLLTDLIGIHALFGAFLLGAIIPHDSKLTHACQGKLEDVVTILLMPTFFAYTGTRTQIGLLSEPSDWLICGIIIVVATVGKLGGTYAAARFTGLDWRTSAALGVLMNTRGLMELIVLNIGLDLGIISPSLFAMMVLMALVTTIATTPLLNWLAPRELLVNQPRTEPTTA